MAKKTAQATTEPTAFLKEVDDFLHHEKMAKLWEQYKVVVYSSVIVLFIAVGGNAYYNQQKEEKLSKQASKWWNVNQSKTPNEAKKSLHEVIATSAFGYRMLGHMELAKAALAENDIATALKEVRTLKNDEQADVIYRDMATLFEGQILMSEDQEKAKAVFIGLDNSKSPFQLSALEMLAMIAEKNGSKTKAVALYERILEAQDITVSMRDRANLRMRHIKTKLK